GNFVLTGLDVVASTGQGKSQPVVLARAVADFSQKGFPVTSLLPGRPRTGWAVEGHARRGPRTAVFTFAKPLPGGPRTVLTVRLTHASIYAKHNIGRLRLSVTSDPRPGLGEGPGLPALVVAALKAEPAMRTAAQKEALAAHYRTIAPERA